MERKAMKIVEEEQAKADNVHTTLTVPKTWIEGNTGIDAQYKAMSDFMEGKMRRDTALEIRGQYQSVRKLMDAQMDKDGIAEEGMDELLKKMEILANKFGGIDHTFHFGQSSMLWLFIHCCRFRLFEFCMCDLSLLFMGLVAV